MAELREVTLDGWKVALLDEVLFQAATKLSDAGEPAPEPKVTTSLDVTITAADDGSLLLQFESEVDGTVSTSLHPPF